MATAKQQENMLLTEHFTWPPISLIDEIINTINEVLYRCTQILDNELSSIDASHLGFLDRALAEHRTPEVDEEGNQTFPEAKLEIEEGVLKLETLVENAVDKNFDKLEIWTLRNVFCLSRGGKAGDGAEAEEIGKWIRLGHYENISTPPKNPNLTPEALHLLRRKLQETQKLHAALLAEKTRNELQIQKLRSLLQPSSQKREARSSTSPAKQANTKANGDGAFAFLTHTPTAQTLGLQQPPAPTNPSNSNPRTTAVGSGEKPTSAAEHSHPLTTHTQFTTTQLPYLRTLLAALRPHVPATALPVQRTGGREEMAKERKVYIESQSKRILEKRGVDTRDGVEGVVEGSRGSGDEVRGLESVLQGLVGKARGNDVDAEAGAQEDKDGRREGEADGDAMDLS